MKKSLLLLLLSMTAVITSSVAQNKTLGVGTTTPNANAALHVESPTNNQGVIIPRLTTAQRGSFTGALTGADVGLIVFDTDLRSLAIWDGSAWTFGSKVGEPITATSSAATGNAGTFTIGNASNNDVAINATTTGTGHAAYIENTNPANANATLFVGTNGTGNAITANAPIVSQHAGAAISAGVFVNQNAANPNAAIYGQTVGSGPVISALNLGTSRAAQFEINNASNASNAIEVTTNGTGAGANFSVTNASSNASAVNITHAGIGNAITANAPIQATSFIGDGSALTGISGFTLPSSNSVSTATPSLFIDNANGLQPAASFSSNNATDATLLTTSSGAFALRAQQTSAAGVAGLFHANNPGNNSDALQGISDGTGNAVYGQNSGNGKAGLFYVTQATNPSPALDAQTLGQGVAISAVNGNTTLGSAAQFVINQATNTSPVVSIVTTGTGNAITANAPIQAPSFIGDGSALSNVISDSARVNTVWGDAIVDFTIENKDISTSTLIDGTKISPSFGSQNIFTTGSVTATSFSGDGSGLTGIDEFTIPYGFNQDVGAPLINLNNTNAIFGTAVFQSAGAGAYTIEATSSGLGAINAQSIGGGAAGVFSSNGGTSTLQATNAGGPALNVTNISTSGPAAYFNISDPTNPNDAIQISHGGTGNAIFANAPIQATSFIGDGSALTGISVANVEVDATNLNVFIGANGTGQSVTTAGSNVGIGTAVLTNLVSDAANTAVGDYALRYTTGGYNSALGYSALTLNTTGTGNVAMGLNSLFSSTAGDFNTAIGRASLASNTTGSQNTAIGDGADVTLGILTNATAIGAGALVSTSNSLVLGNNAKVGIGTSSPTTLLDVHNTSTGTAGYFHINNVANNSNALFVSTDGLGASIYSQNLGTSQSAGQFIVNNGSNTAPAINASSNGTGAAMRLTQSTNGLAMEIFGGGIRYYVAGSLDANVTVSQRATVYRFTSDSGGSGAAINFSFSPAEGERIYVFSEVSGPSITLNGQAIANNQVRSFIYLGSAWRIIN